MDLELSLLMFLKINSIYLMEIRLFRFSKVKEKSKYIFNLIFLCFPKFYICV